MREWNGGFGTSIPTAGHVFNKLASSHVYDVDRLVLFSELQTYPNLHPPPRVDPPLGCLPQRVQFCVGLFSVRSSHCGGGFRGANSYMFCFGQLGRLVQVGANLGGFGALWLVWEN